MMKSDKIGLFFLLRIKSVRGVDRGEAERRACSVRVWEGPSQGLKKGDETRFSPSFLEVLSIWASRCLLQWDAIVGRSQGGLKKRSKSGRFCEKDRGS